MIAWWFDNKSVYDLPSLRKGDNQKYSSVTSSSFNWLQEVGPLPLILPFQTYAIQQLGVNVYKRKKE